MAGGHGRRGGAFASTLQELLHGLREDALAPRALAGSKRWLEAGGTGGTGGKRWREAARRKSGHSLHKLRKRWLEAGGTGWKPEALAGSRAGCRRQALAGSRKAEIRTFPAQAAQLWQPLRKNPWGIGFSVCAHHANWVHGGDGSDRAGGLLEQSSGVVCSSGKSPSNVVGFHPACPKCPSQTKRRCRRWSPMRKSSATTAASAGSFHRMLLAGCSTIKKTCRLTKSLIKNATHSASAFAEATSRRATSPNGFFCVRLVCPRGRKTKELQGTPSQQTAPRCSLKHMDMAFASPTTVNKFMRRPSPYRTSRNASPGRSRLSRAHRARKIARRTASRGQPRARPS